MVKNRLCSSLTENSKEHELTSHDPAVVLKQHLEIRQCNCSVYGAIIFKTLLPWVLPSTWCIHSLTSSNAGRKNCPIMGGGMKSSSIQQQHHRLNKITWHTMKGNLQWKIKYNLCTNNGPWLNIQFTRLQRQQQSKRQEFPRGTKSQKAVNSCCVSYCLSVHAEPLVGPRNTPPSVYKESCPRWLLMLRFIFQFT